jgi:phosphatidylglycerol:prolipoprotein diacylglycerol transferase
MPYTARGAHVHRLAPSTSSAERSVQQTSTDPIQHVSPFARDGNDELREIHTSPPRLARGAGRRPLEITESRVGFMRDLEPQSLGISYWFDAAPIGEPYSVTVHFAGRLRGNPPTGGKESFAVVGTAENVLPGSGRVVLTVRVPDLPAGSTWDVTATPVEPAAPGSTSQWSVRNDPRLPVAAACGTTMFTPFAAQVAPGVRLGAWPTLVAAGGIFALLVQSLLAARLGLPTSRLLPLSVLACVLGVVGAKTYYLATHRSEPVGLLTIGMSVQGFVLVAVSTLLAGTLLLGLPLGTVLDVTTPGMLAGMAVGRLGCLLGGCCVGRPTTSRWGVWSSDRRVGQRRIPVQAIESTLAGGLALLAAVGVLDWGTSSDGVIFFAGIAAYTAGRQLLFPMRMMPRATAHGRIVTLITSCTISLTALLVALVR